jgi:hypothetical protein
MRVMFAPSRQGDDHPHRIRDLGEAHFSADTAPMAAAAYPTDTTKTRTTGPIRAQLLATKRMTPRPTSTAPMVAKIVTARPSYAGVRVPRDRPEARRPVPQ